MPLRSIKILFLVLLLVFSGGLAAEVSAKKIRRTMLFIRPMLMGGAQVALGDETSTLFYNPAGFAGLGDGTVEPLTTHMMMDERLKKLLIDKTAVQDEFKSLTLANLQSLFDTTVYSEVTLRVPVLTSPEKGIVYGMGASALVDVEIYKAYELLGIPIPGLHIEFYVDQTVLFSFSKQYGNGISMGITPKYIRRMGLDKDIDALTLFDISDPGSFLDLENDPDYQAVGQGKIYNSYGFDLGFIYQFPNATLWRPRVGYAVVNVGGYKTGIGLTGITFGDKRSDGTYQAGELPALHTVGFAISPVYHNVRYSLAIDFVDVTRQVLPGDAWPLRSRIGLEIGVDPRKDGTSLFSLLAGYNARHFSVGFLTRVGILEIGMGRYEVERGDYPGDKPDLRRAILVGFRF